MNRTTATLFSLATALMLTAQENVRVVTNVVKGAAPTWKTWKSPECGMNYPGSWSMVTGMGDTIAKFESPGESEHATLTVMEKPLAGLTLEQFHQANGPAQFTGSTDTRVMDDSGPDASGAYSYSYVTATDGGPLWQRQDVVIANDKAYMLTYTAAEQNYAENLYMAEAMINSFSPGGGE